MDKSFGFTIRPKDGLVKDSICEDKILKAIERITPYHHCVAEKEGIERHLHFQLWFNETKRKGDIKKVFTRICEKEDWWDADHKRHCIKDKHCYNDWYDGYLIGNENKQSDKSEELLCNIPPHTDEYYPSEEDQQKWKDESKAVDKTFHKLYTLWYEYYNDKPTELAEVSKFFNKLMFKDKIIKVIEDKRRRTQRVECLYNYIVGSAKVSFSLTEEQNQHYESMKEAGHYIPNKPKKNLCEKLLV